jgi:hypothetical protein
MVQTELADEKAQHGLTKQLFSNLFSGWENELQPRIHRNFCLLSLS